MKSSLSPETLIEIYMRGQCHSHALAAIETHGGGLAIAYDDSEIHFEEGEDSVSSVVHVWSIHEAAEGLIARDALGDIPFTKDAMIAHLEDFFPDMIGKHEFGDLWIDMQATREEIAELSGNEDHQPLMEIDELFIEETKLLPSVTDAPGMRKFEMQPDPADHGMGI